MTAAVFDLDQQTLDRRIDTLFRERWLARLKKVDRMFAILMVAQWMFAVVFAWLFSPYAWSGKTRVIHTHVYVAVLMGAALTLLPVLLAKFRGGSPLTRHVFAISQMLMSALLIHLTGGRVETHFHVFGSLAFLAFYLDWRVLITATVTVVSEHFLRGMLWPESIYGVTNPEWWRFLEHAFWVAFEDAVLMWACVSALADLRSAAAQQVAVERLTELERSKTIALELALAESRLEQDRRIASLGKLAASVAHHFNNVLMGISPFLDILRRQPAADRSGNAIDQIARSVNRGKRITEDILRFTQPADPVLANVDVGAWLRGVVSEARSLLSSRYAVDAVVSDEGIAEGRMIVSADADQLTQTFMNLIVNARDAMPDGGAVVIRASVPEAGARFSFGAVERPERFVHLSVEDGGAGIDDQTMRHIFEPLFTTKRNGTGIGLTVAHHVIRRHGGEIFVESRLGAGTKFHVFLPRAEHAAQALDDARSPLPRQRVTRVLLVEDERAVSAGLIALLGLEGVHVDLVETGGEVLDAITRFKPEAVILDVGLPDMDGAKVFALIAERHPALPVIFSTGHGDQSKLDEHLTKPHVGFLLKPYEVETLLESLDRVASRACAVLSPDLSPES